MKAIKSNANKSKSDIDSVSERSSVASVSQSNKDDKQSENQSKNSNLSYIERDIEATQKEIDWSFQSGKLDFDKKLFPQFRQRNQIKTPYSYTLLEDAMYVDEGVVITLQYQIFNDNQDHIKLTDVTDELTLDGKQVSKLNTNNYQKEGYHPMSIFRNPPKNFEDRNDIIVENSEVGDYMTAEEKELGQSFKIEGVLAFWRTAASGKMEKICEKSFTTGMPFAYTRQGNMQLQVTNDKKVLTIAYISNYSDQEDEGNIEDNLIKSYTQVKIMGWTIDVKTCTFTKEIHSKFQIMNEHLQKYLHENAKNIQLIKSIKLTASRNYIILTYNQQSNRIDSLALEPARDPQIENYYTRAKNDSKKIARKYAIFEVASGKLLFEYGGAYQELYLPDQSVKIYNLGLAIQDTQYLQSNQSHKNFSKAASTIDEDIVFFCAGHLVDWSTNIQNLQAKLEKNIRLFTESGKEKERQDKKYKDFDWTLAVKRIPLEEIIESGKNPTKRKEWVQKQIINYCNQLKYEEVAQKECFQFKSKCITFREDWESSIIIQVNSHFDQIGVLNVPQVSNSYNSRCFFLYNLKQIETFASQKNLFGKLTSKNVQTMPQIIKALPKEGLIQHGRNSQLKKDMYITVQPPGLKGYGQCIKLDNKDQKLNFQIQVNLNHDPYNTFDIWCFEEKYMKGQAQLNGEIDDENHLQLLDNDKRQVMQICSIDTNSLQLEIMTKIPRKVSLNRYDYIVKSSDTLQQQQAQWPFFAYNLGIEKVALIHLTREARSREYIYKLQEGHKFICFAEFNNYKDVGFFAEGLLIEACVKFSFLTEFKDEFFLNILLIDPYHSPMQFSLFTSSHVVLKKDFKADDMVELCYIIPNKRSQEVVGFDKEFTIYLIIQYQNILKRCKFKQSDPTQLNEDDSDYGLNYSDVLIDQKLSTTKKTFLEQVFMQYDEKNFIYYIARQGQICKIMEINPKKSKIRNHECIYEIKSDKCLGFSVSSNGQQFRFVDHNKTFFNLERIMDQRMLKLVSENNMNETFQSDFEELNYTPQIIHSQYIIQQSKIFYLWNNDPYPNGIFMQGDLFEFDKKQLHPQFKNHMRWFQGPIAFIGSNQYGVVDRVKKFYAFLNILPLPESTTKTLLVDNMNMVDISTFLTNGDILIRCGYRYLVFDADGFFKSQVSFSDADNLKGEENQATNFTQSFQKLFKKKFKQKKIDPIAEGLLEYGLQDGGQSSDEFEQTYHLGQHNKMDLLQFSDDNKKFLFLNQISQRMIVYELIKMTDTNKDGKQVDQYQFSKMFSLDYKNSDLLKEGKKFMHGEHKFPFRDFIDKCLTINVAEDGSVNMILISQPDRKVDEDMRTTFFEIIISLFKVDFQNGRYKVITHNIKEQIHRPASEDIEVCHGYEKDYIERRINDSKQIQQRLPNHLKDGTDLEILQDNLLYLEYRKRRLIHAQIQDNIVILWQGSWLRWAKIQQEQEEQYKLQPLQRIYVTLNPLDEIMRTQYIQIKEKVNSGYYPERKQTNIELIQIILKVHSIDQYNNKYIIFSWSLNDDQQYTILEEEDYQNEMLELNLLKGMHSKLNYYQDSCTIVDLDLSVSILVTRSQVEQNQHRSYASIKLLLLKFQNQRKVFQNTSRWLQPLRPECLVFSYSFIHLRLWADINQLKNKLSLFKKVVSLSDFTIDFDGQSLWHVYIQKSEIIQYIHDLFIQKRQQGKLVGSEHYLPLLMMNADVENYTPFFKCIQAENYKTFELLCSICTDNQTNFITRNIIRSLPWMLMNESQSVLNYFDHNTYIPMAFIEPLILPWPEELADVDQVFIPVKTTLLSISEILAILTSKDEKKSDDVQLIIVDKKPAVLEDEETKLLNQLEKLKEDVEFLTALRNGNTTQRSKSRSWILTDDIKDESLTAQLKGGDEDEEKDRNSKNKRVQISVIDFDFLFQNDNSVTLIQVLASLETNKILTRKSIKAFIGLMWKSYQNAIFYRIFLLYFAYLFMTIYLCAIQLPVLWEMVAIKKEDIKNGTYDPAHEPNKTIVYLNILFSFLILTFFAKFEFIQLMEDGIIAYFGTIWNFCDAASMGINYFLLIYAQYYCYFEEPFVSEMQIVRIAAFGNFLMWFKMFYWMRLFQSTARYVQLISQTTTDLAYFIIMVMIIILSFATFFFIINYNGKAAGFSYIPNYGMNPFVSAIVNIYLVTLGDFAYSNYSQGPNVASTWIMFLACSFFNCVMFMNMLVAIMSKTFEDVTATEEENGLQQQVGLIADYVTLLDHQEIWGKSRYIIEVKVVEQGQEQDLGVKELLHEMQESIAINCVRNNQNYQKKISVVEKMLENLKGYQGEMKDYMQQIIYSVKDSENFSQIQSTQQSIQQNLQNGDASPGRGGFFGFS